MRHISRTTFVEYLMLEWRQKRRNALYSIERFNVNKRQHVNNLPFRDKRH